MRITRYILGSLVFPYAAVLMVAAAFAQQTEAPCEGRLNGEEFPFLVPEYVAWEDIFTRAQRTQPTGSGLQLTESGRQSLQATGSLALKRAAALRATPVQPGAISPNSAAADLLLEARDDLLRTLSTVDTARLVEAVESTRRQTRYAFAKPGRRVNIPIANITCLITIKGKDQPELIPEAYYWEFHLRSLASISAEHRIGGAAYTADYMSALRHHLRIPDRDVIAVLTTAAETLLQVDAARAKYTDSRDAESAVASIVRAARLKLLRSLPRESWVAVQRDAARARVGTVYDFPTTY
jgi:hypothetical protein